jgi:hypothetical protein
MPPDALVMKVITSSDKTVLVAARSDVGRGPPYHAAEIGPPLGTSRRSRSDGRW